MASLPNLSECPGFDSDVSQCGECHDCANCLMSFKLTNCKYMFGCASCTDCSGLVKEHDLQGVHKDPVNFAIIAAGSMGWRSPDEVVDKMYDWALKYTTGRVPWDLPANPEPISAVGSGRIAIAAFGTRGDVQPAVALALALQKAGYTVRMLVNSPHDELCKAFKLDVVGFPDWTPPFDVVTCVQADGKLQRGFYEGILDFKPEILLYSKLACVEAWIVEEQLGVKTLQYSFQDTMTEPMLWKNGVFGSRVHFDLGLGKRFLQGINGETVIDFNGRNRPAMKAISGVVAGPLPFPAKGTVIGQHITGYWTIDMKLQEELMDQGSPLFGGQYKKELAEFLEKGSPPAYIGWGSMSAEPAKAQMAVRSLKETDKRGVILGGEAGIGPTALEGCPDSEELKAYADSNILFLPSAPHEWLLPRCCLAVHHGGAGTVAATLRAGLPTIVTPVAVDQFYWAKVITEKGLGVGTGELKDLKGEHLTMAIRHCEKPEVVAAAKAAGETLMAEDGPGNAVKVVEETLKILRGGGDIKGKREVGCDPSSCQVL